MNMSSGSVTTKKLADLSKDLHRIKKSFKEKNLKTNLSYL